MYPTSARSLVMGYCLCLFVCLFVCFFCWLFSHFTFRVFCCVFFPYTYYIGMQTNCSIFLASKSSVRSSTLQFSYFSRDTSCDSVRPIKTFLRVDRGGSCFLAKNSFSFVINFQTSSCFYQCCSHGLIQSFHQAYNYVAVTRLK